MTYGFGQVGAAGEEPVVPEGAEDLLVTAFPNLTDAQRRAVLAATEIDSGYPLDSTSQGWQRINLPAALSSKVTLDAAGTVISVEPGHAVASVDRSKDIGLPSTGSEPDHSLALAPYVLPAAALLLIVGGIVMASRRGATVESTR